MKGIPSSPCMLKGRRDQPSQCTYLGLGLCLVCFYPVQSVQDMVYYSEPKMKETKASLDEVDPELLATFDRLGISLSEQKRLSNVAVDAVFDSVSIATTFREELSKAGVIFCSISEAIREYPDLVRKYLGRVVPVSLETCLVHIVPSMEPIEKGRLSGYCPLLLYKRFVDSQPVPPIPSTTSSCFLGIISSVIIRCPLPYSPPYLRFKTITLPPSTPPCSATAASATSPRTR